MIKRLQLKNFGPYESADVLLDKFTVIVGPNGAGKSLLFAALKALGRVMRHPLRLAEGRQFGDSKYFGGYPTRTGSGQLCLSDH